MRTGVGVLAAVAALVAVLPTAAQEPAADGIRYEVRRHQVTQTKFVYQVIANVPGADFPFGVVEVRAGVHGYPPEARANEIARRMNVEQAKGDPKWFDQLERRTQGKEVVVGPKGADKWLMTADSNSVKPWGVSNTVQLGDLILSTIQKQLRTWNALRGPVPDEMLGANDLRMRGDLMQDSDDPQWPAVKWYLKALQKDPNLVEAKLGLARFYVKRGHPSEAADWYRQARADVNRQAKPDLLQREQLSFIKARLTRKPAGQ